MAAETQEPCLRRVVAGRDPRRIAVNVSDTFAFADGLTHAEHRWLTEALGPDLSTRLVSADGVAIGWLERRLPEELAAADTNNRIAHALIAEAFSSRVIQPGATRATDVACWLRERTRSLGLATDMQQNAYVPRLGETAVPEGMAAALRTANRQQDLLATEQVVAFHQGRIAYLGGRQERLHLVA